MVGFVIVHTPWNALSNPELRRSCKALHSELVLPVATSLSNICWKENPLTVDAIKKQLPSATEYSLALDRWSSTNKLDIPSVIAYNGDLYWALHTVQLAFNEVNHQCCSRFER
jgi:hypothetical protein